MYKACKYCETEHTLRGAACRVCKDGVFRYGMTRLDQMKLYKDQEKKCKLCDSEITMFDGHRGGFIDHNHLTGKVRGILCNRCNIVVGGLETHSNPERLLKYINISA
jgi:hypothetical protein